MVFEKFWEANNDVEGLVFIANRFKDLEGVIAKV